MEREKRTLFLVFLTLVVYGSSILLQEGMFILPFPLFEFLFFVVCIQFAFWNRTQVTPAIFACTIGLVHLIAAPTIWTFFLDASQMMALDESLFFDLSKIVFYLLLLVAGISTAAKQKSTLHWIFMVIFATFVVLGAIFPMWIIILAYLSMMVSTWIKPVFQPFDFLWLLLFVLEGSYWLIMFFSA